ncbi:MAG TPA: hypothetical protein VL475_15040, partial [Planctomycetaceae bacterium]|nr:hypothetical protein [Planctomycetaceae bacterium]
MSHWLQSSRVSARQAALKRRLVAVLVCAVAFVASSLCALEFEEFPVVNGAGEIPTVLAVRELIAARIHQGPNAEFDGWFYGGLTAAAARQHLESLLKLKVDDAVELCRLNDVQKQKLQLAGDVDIRRFFESTRDLARRLEAARSRQANLGEFVAEAHLLRVSLDYELCDDRSFFAKTLRNALTAEQLAEFDRTERARRQHRYATRVVATTLKLKNLLDLRREQCENLVRLLTEKTPPLRKFGRYDFDVVLYQMSQLVEADLNAVFDPAQWGALKKLLVRIQAMKPFFEEAGLVETVGTRSSKTDDPTEKKLSGDRDSSDRDGATADLRRVIRLLLEEIEFAEKDEIRSDDLAKRAWGPEQVVGPPDTPQAGDIATAWASQTEDDRLEWLI